MSNCTLTGLLSVTHIWGLMGILSIFVDVIFGFGFAVLVVFSVLWGRSGGIKATNNYVVAATISTET